MARRITAIASSIMLVGALIFVAPQHARAADFHDFYRIPSGWLTGGVLNVTAWNTTNFSSPWNTPPVGATCYAAAVSEIHNDWGSDGVFASCNTDNVLVKFSGSITSPDSGPIDFCNNSDDGFYLELGGRPVIASNWVDQGGGGCYYPINANEWQQNSGTYTFSAGIPVAFEAWYYEHSGNAQVNLYYSPSPCALDAGVCPAITEVGANRVTGAPGTDHTTELATYTWLRCRNEGEALESRRAPIDCRVIRSSMRSNAARMANAPYRITGVDRVWGYLRLAVTVGRTTYYSGTYDLNR